MSGCRPKRWSLQEICAVPRKELALQDGDFSRSKCGDRVVDDHDGSPGSGLGQRRAFGEFIGPWRPLSRQRLRALHACTLAESSGLISRWPPRAHGRQGPSLRAENSALEVVMTYWTRRGVVSQHRSTLRHHRAQPTQRQDVRRFARPPWAARIVRQLTQLASPNTDRGHVAEATRRCCDRRWDCV